MEKASDISYIKLIPRLDVHEEKLYIDNYSNDVISGIAKKMYTDVYDFKEECVRNALIALGWAPPDTDADGRT